MNTRTALGTCLVLTAILAGAAFLDRAQRLVPVYAAARDLPAGTTLDHGDLVVVRVRLPTTALRHYLQPTRGQTVAGRVLAAPVRQETLVPAELLLASSAAADQVELPVQADPGDMAQGLRPGDQVQVLAAYTEGARRGDATVLLPAAEVVRVLEDLGGLTGGGRPTGVQLRMPSARVPQVAAAIATARIFLIKVPATALPAPPSRRPPTRPSRPPTTHPPPRHEDPAGHRGRRRRLGGRPGTGMPGGRGARRDPPPLLRPRRPARRGCRRPGEAAVVAAGTRWLDHDALARLAAAGLAVVGVAPAGDEDSERCLRQLGLHHVGADTDPPATLVDLTRAALSAEPAPDPPTPADAPPPPDHDVPHVLLAVWGPKGAPGRTTVAVNLAFEAAPLVGEVLLVDADTYGGAVAQTLGFLEDTPGLAWAARLAGRGELDAPRLWHATRPAAPGAPRVLTGLPRAELWTEVRAGTWESLLELFRAAFPFTVIDAGFCLEEDEELLYDQVRLRRNAVTRLALQRCDLVVAVARADPVGLHAFIRGYQELRDLGVPPRRVRVVVNQLRPGLFGGDRPAEQVGTALHRYLGIQPAAFVPYDRAGVDAALLAGQALREARPGCPAQQAIAGLAVALAPRTPTRRGRRRARAGRQSGPAPATP